MHVAAVKRMHFRQSCKNRPTSLIPRPPHSFCHEMPGIFYRVNDRVEHKASWQSRTVVLLAVFAKHRKTLDKSLGRGILFFCFYCSTCTQSTPVQYTIHTRNRHWPHYVISFQSRVHTYLCCCFCSNPFNRHHWIF